METFTVEILHQGEPQHLVDLTDTNPEDACRRARSAIFMMALKDGREWKLDDIEARLYA
jgi:hypothetical protein